MEKPRMTTTAGRMKTAPALRSSLAPMGRHVAETTREAREDARLLIRAPSFSLVPGTEGGGGEVRVTSPPGSLLRDAEARPVGVQLRRAADLVRLLVPLVGDLSHCLALTQLTREVLRQRSIESGLLVEGSLRDAQVEHHVRALQARLDGSEVVRRRLSAHSGREPRALIGEVGIAIRVEASLADRHVLARLRGLRHVGEERERGILDLG